MISSAPYFACVHSASFQLFFFDVIFTVFCCIFKGVAVYLLEDCICKLQMVIAL